MRLRLFGDRSQISPNASQSEYVSHIQDCLRAWIFRSIPKREFFVIPLMRLRLFGKRFQIPPYVFQTECVSHIKDSLRAWVFESIPKREFLRFLSWDFDFLENAFQTLATYHKQNMYSILMTLCGCGYSILSQNENFCEFVLGSLQNPAEYYIIRGINIMGNILESVVFML